MYDESFDACEDVEFNTRVAAAGYKAYTDPRLSVYYEPRNSFRGLFRQMMRYGIGRVRLARKHPESASLSQWAPAVLVAAFAIAGVSVAAAILTGHWLFSVAAFPAAMFVLITIVASMHLGWRHGLIACFAGSNCVWLYLSRTGYWYVDGTGWHYAPADAHIKRVDSSGARRLKAQESMDCFRTKLRIAVRS